MGAFGEIVWDALNAARMLASVNVKVVGRWAVPGLATYVELRIRDAIGGRERHVDAVVVRLVDLPNGTSRPHCLVLAWLTSNVHTFTEAVGEDVYTAVDAAVVKIDAAITRLIRPRAVFGTVGDVVETCADRTGSRF
jgi:hypothetical protein